MVVREQGRVRLISRDGYDWAHRFPLIVAGALKVRQKHFVLDGEVVVLDKDGVSDFDALHRPMALLLRKANLARLLKRRVDVIAEYEQGDIGEALFRVACNMGLEGIVSKRLDRAYGAGRCANWIKVKNPAPDVQQSESAGARVGEGAA
jgi:bifunctional non-homologous end joining protein LigD